MNDVIFNLSYKYKLKTKIIDELVQIRALNVIDLCYSFLYNLCSD